MTVAVLADSPTLTTGFGVTTSHIAGALARQGHDVACFGIKAGPEDVAEGALPYRVWPAQQGGHWTQTLPEFFATVRPQVLLLNMDAYNAVECLDSCAAAGWRGPTVSYVCFDGLPVGRVYLDAQRSCASVWATSHTGAAYLGKEGIEVAGVAPPGVDRSVFRPDPDPAGLRERAGVSGATVVGVFATNTERKQVARTVAGFARAVELLPHLDLRMYLHCRPDGFWRLRELADSLGVGGRMIFPSAAGFREHLGVPTSGDAEQRGKDGRVSGTLPESLSYVDRINCCDVLVNASYSGDVEQVIIEGQACGVPVLNTDDEGVMTEALGDGGLRLSAGDVGIGPLGQRLHHVSPEHIAEALVAVVTDEELRATARAAGFNNAARYPWSVLEEAAGAMVRPYVTTR